MRDTTSASFARLELAVVSAAVFLAPYNAVRHPAFFFTLSDLLFVIAVTLRLRSGWPLRPLGGGTLMWYTGFLMLSFGLLVSSLFNGDIARAWIIFAQYLFAYVGLPFALMRMSYDEAIRLARYCVYGMVAMCIFGIAVYATGHTGGYTRHFAIVTGGGRLTGLVDNANTMGGYLALTFPLLWCLATVGAIRLPVAIVLSIPLAVGLVLTSSNTGMLSTLIAAVIFLVGRRQLKLLAVACVVAALLAVAVYLWGEHFLPAVFQRRVLNAVTEGDITEAGTFVSRYELIKEAWRLADTHLFLGMGADQYRLASESGLNVHNAYLLLLNEGGLVTVCGYLVILSSALVAPFQARNHRHGGTTLLCAVAIAATVSFVAFSSTHMYARFLTVPLLLAVGLAVTSPVRRRRRSGVELGFQGGKGDLAPARWLAV